MTKKKESSECVRKSDDTLRFRVTKFKILFREQKCPLGLLYIASDWFYGR